MNIISGLYLLYFSKVSAAVNSTIIVLPIVLFFTPLLYMRNRGQKGEKDIHFRTNLKMALFKSLVLIKQAQDSSSTSMEKVPRQSQNKNKNEPCHFYQLQFK